MHNPAFYVSALLDLHKVRDASERRALWRQCMTALAQSSSDGPGPLNGFHPESLLLGARVALKDGLVDDLDWLEPARAGAALYEFASSLPLGQEQRELGRRVLSRLLAGDAQTFTQLATRIALGAGKGLSTGAVRARMALVVEMPLSEGIADGPLSLALASRRELVREWITTPSSGPLSSRRLVARLLERAAREASRRASQGDPHALRVFRSDAVFETMHRLLSDRESLVWRHLATARGLLSPWISGYEADMREALAPELSPTEWRRSVCSYAASVAVGGAESKVRAERALLDVLARDPGASGPFVWGLARAAEAEPEAAVELLRLACSRAPRDTAEPLIELHEELGDTELLREAMHDVARALSQHRPDESDDGAEALRLEIVRELELAPRADEPVRHQLSRALLRFSHEGARAAFQAAEEVLGAAKGAIDALEAVAGEEGQGARIARRASLSVLRDLDASVLERETLGDLLRLGSTARAYNDQFDDVRERMGEWLLAREGAPLTEEPSHPTLSLRRLRALLHLVDGDMGEAHDDGPRAARLRKWWHRVARQLLARFEKDRQTTVRRTTVAALARAMDALVRSGHIDASDALLVAARRVHDPALFDTLAEAAMVPDLVHVLTQYARFVRTSSQPQEKPAGDGMDSLPPPAPFAPGLSGLEVLARELAMDASGRTEQLRLVLSRLHASLDAVRKAPSLRALSTTGSAEPDVIAALEAALGSLAQMALGARARFDPEAAPASPNVSAAGKKPLSMAVSRVLSGTDPVLRDVMVSSCLDELLAPLPKAMAALVADVVFGLVELPVDRPSYDRESLGTVGIADALPPWIPARRTLGGFYVLRSLSHGAVGSVFVVTRVEDRREPNAERFALKVPEYSATAARSVSEAEFLKMFREEASALLVLPQHPNLARFVTFDAGARPKPLLVMELVEGMTLERILASGPMEWTRGIRILDDVLSGLEAMHAVGVGHLDLKPSNVVLRKDGQAVLVDFGLAGRHIRPGCATGPYGAPEVWTGDQRAASPMAADMYAFACVAFEVFSGETLFDADSEMAQIALHVAHDGLPPGLRAVSERPEFAPITELLFSCLRRDPKARISASDARAYLRRWGQTLSRRSSPALSHGS